MNMLRLVWDKAADTPVRGEWEPLQDVGLGDLGAVESVIDTGSKRFLSEQH